MPTTAAGKLFGIDEAGYGPNLGPLVICLTAWDVPSTPAKTDLAKLFSNVVDRQSNCEGTKLHVADSKLVNVGKNGFANLETSAVSLLRLAGIDTTSLKTIWQGLFGRQPDGETSPWFADDLKLPVRADESSLIAHVDRFHNCLDENEIQLASITSQIFPAAIFNTLLDQHDSKGVVLSKLTIELLGKSWDPKSSTPSLIIGDKHGGRNRYDELLADITGDEMIFRIEEGRVVSRYRVVNSEIRFQTKGEQHLQVAAASIVAKYVRELSMIQFNRFWSQHCPNIKPTKGYPVDAKRFREDIRSVQQELKIEDRVLWRRR